MSNIGVAKIVGPTDPFIEEEITYTISEWLEDTPMELRDSSKVTWVLYRVDKSGELKSLGTKKEGKYIFGTIAVGVKYVIKAYLEESELTNQEGITVILKDEYAKVRATGAKSIQRVELRLADGTLIVKALGYMDMIFVKVKCINMVGDKVTVSLWKGQKLGLGSDVTSTLVRQSAPLTVDKYGYVYYSFSLMGSYGLAQQSSSSSDEFYVTADYNVVKKEETKKDDNPKAIEETTASINNKKSQKEANKAHNKTPNTKKNTKPREDTAKTSTNAASKNNTSDSKGNITSVELLDAKGKPYKERPKFGESIYLVVKGKNLKGKEFTFNLWEDDNIGDNDLIHTEKRIFTFDDPYYRLKINLNSDMQKKGEYGVNDKNLDRGEYITGRYQEIFAEIILDTASKKSSIIDVSINEEFKAEYDKTMAKISTDEVNGTNKNGKCSKCNEDITLDQLKKICVDKKGKCLIIDDTMIKNALPTFNSYRIKAGINTCLLKAHFLAQISQESKFYELQENFKYSDPERMRKIFFSYFKTFGDDVKKQRVEAKRLSVLSFDKKNHEEVANAIYGKTHPNGVDHILSDDGWRYSGKGFKQITWKGNYLKLEKYVINKFGVDVKWVGGENPFKLKLNAKDAMLSALAYWGSNELSSIAKDKSDATITKVTKKINDKLEGLDERIRYFRKAIEVLEVDSCKMGEVSKNKEKGTVVVISGISKKYGEEKGGGNRWPVYPIKVYRNLSIETYKKNKKSLTPDYEHYVARDAANNSTRSIKRYGSSNECPPGEYFLNKGSDAQKYQVYISDSEGIGGASISGEDGWRGGIAIHGGWPSGTEGCLSTHSSNYGNKKKNQPTNPLVKILIDNIPDFEDNNDDRPVRLIIEERKISKENNNWLGVIE